MAATVSLWLVIFLVLIAPFDVAELAFHIRLEIMPIYGVISFISYIVLVPIQNWVVKRTNSWTIIQEISFLLIFSLLSHVGCFLYYSSEIVRGNLDYWDFTKQIYLPIFFLLLVLLIFARWLLINKKFSRSPSLPMRSLLKEITNEMYCRSITRN